MGLQARPQRARRAASPRGCFAAGDAYEGADLSADDRAARSTKNFGHTHCKQANTQLRAAWSRHGRSQLAWRHPNNHCAASHLPVGRRGIADEGGSPGVFPRPNHSKLRAQECTAWAMRLGQDHAGVRPPRGRVPVHNPVRAGLHSLRGGLFPASVHSATADTSGNSPARYEVPDQGRACPQGGSGRAAPARSNRRPTVQIVRWPRRHSPNTLAGAGNAYRSAAKTCSGRP
jgi:hypothetical protein